MKSVDLSAARVEINSSLERFVIRESQLLNGIGNELEIATSAMSRYILGSGKRLRPLFAYVGYLGTQNQLNQSLITAFSSLELIHVCALMHDDLMDSSDTRRGVPSLHREFENYHRSNGLTGRADQFGAATAILLGDLALVWSAKMFHQSGIKNEELINSLEIYDELRVELMAGQFLDINEQTLSTSSIERSMKIARYKSGKYTIERPLHFGAALGGRKDLFEAYSNYGLPLGEAFQLRDDLLGVFGESEITGKPTGDDLLEGKRTALIAKTFELANASQAMALSMVLGKRDATLESIERAKSIIIETGAQKFVEQMITDLSEQAHSAISGLPNESALSELISIAAKRSS